MVIISGEERKKMPPYITIKPIKTIPNAKLRILFILLEYLTMLFLPPIETIPYLSKEKKG
jgi:hypothetical protein